MIKEYGHDIQLLFLRMMVTNAELFTRVTNIINPDNFDKKLKPVCEFIVEHSKKYNVVPDSLQIKSVTSIEVDAITELGDEHTNWFLDEFESFTKRQELERAILKSADLLEKGDYGPVEKLIKDAVQISLQKDMGIDYFIDPRSRLMTLKSSNGQNSTGWPSMDQKLYGGFNRGELQIFAGGSGCVTYDTIVEVIELPNILFIYEQVKDEWEYLIKFYSPAELDYYAKGDYKKIKSLYQKTQPKKIPIGSLFGKTESSTFLVSSPDGWVPVTDCIEKIKTDMYSIIFESGIYINASHDHLFQKPDLTWHYARDMIIGDTLLSVNGEDRIINIIRTSNVKTKVYDLSVNHDNHRYYTDTICSHNSGKSLFMQNLAVNWVQSGLNGAYITLELSEGLCSMRIDSMMTDTSSREIFKDIDTVEMKIKMLAKKSGKLRVKYMPAQSNVNDLRAYCKELQIQTGVKIDFLCVDYLDLLMPVGAKVSPSDLFVKDKYVSEELRNLAKELNVLFVTASQLNRGAVEEIEFDHSHISGGISKINTADNVFGIFTSRSMRERGQYQLQLMKTRSSSGVGQKIELEFNIETLRITDPNKDEGEGSSIGYNKPKPNHSLNVIKANVDQKTGEILDSSVPEKKIVADVKSNKLKALLNDLKNKKN
jgi:replicative DNA helicase